MFQQYFSKYMQNLIDFTTKEDVEIHEDIKESCKLDNNKTLPLLNYYLKLLTI